MGDVVILPMVRVEHEPQDNARLALVRVIPDISREQIDVFLTKLWREGYEIVPVADCE